MRESVVYKLERKTEEDVSMVFEDLEAIEEIVDSEIAEEGFFDFKIAEENLLLHSLSDRLMWLLAAPSH